MVIDFEELEASIKEHDKQRDQAFKDGMDKLRSRERKMYESVDDIALKMVERDRKNKADQIQRKIKADTAEAEKQIDIVNGGDSPTDKALRQMLRSQAR